MALIARRRAWARSCNRRMLKTDSVNRPVRSKIVVIIALNKRSGVAVASDGSIFVSDGYCNTRIVKYNANGQYEAHFEAPKSNGRGYFVCFFRYTSICILPAATSPAFNLPHDIVADSAAALLYIADRQNGRLVVTNYKGELKGEIRPTRQFSTVYSADIHPAST